MGSVVTAVAMGYREVGGRGGGGLVEELGGG